MRKILTGKWKPAIDFDGEREKDKPVVIFVYNLAVDPDIEINCPRQLSLSFEQ